MNTNQGFFIATADKYPIFHIYEEFEVTVDNNTTSHPIFGFDLSEAIKDLHEIIQETADEYNEDANVNFEIFYTEGKLNQDGQFIKTRAYEINTYRAKKFGIIK